MTNSSAIICGQDTPNILSGAAGLFPAPKTYRSPGGREISGWAGRESSEMRRCAELCCGVSRARLPVALCEVELPVLVQPVELVLGDL